MGPITSILFITTTEKDQQLFSRVMASINAVVECFNTNDLKDALDWLTNDVYALPSLIFMESPAENTEDKHLVKSITRISLTHGIPIVTFQTWQAGLLQV